MGRSTGVQLHLLLAVGLKVTDVAAQVQGWDGPIWSPISQGRRHRGTHSPAPFPQVGCQLVLLGMFVGFEVQLEVGLELGAIAAELTTVCVSSYLLPLSLGQAAAHAAVV